MEVMYLLIPFSAALVLLILAVFGWALHRGQFDDLEREGERILAQDVGEVDGRQAESAEPVEKSRSVTDELKAGETNGK